MKTLLSFSLLLLGLSAQANVCKSSNGLLQTWRNQKNWQDVKVMTSDTASAIGYDAVVTDQDQVLLQPFEIKQDYKTEMTVEIQDHYSKSEFIKICKEDKHNGRRLSRARAKGSQNRFRLPVRFFPETNQVQGLALAAQDFKMSNVGVRLVFRNGSMVEENLGFLSKLSDTKVALESEINDQLQDSIEDMLKTGFAEINMDGMDDLACDVFKGRAEVELYAISEMKEPEVRLVQEVAPDSVGALYRGFKTAEAPAHSSPEAIFNAGRVYENLSLIGEVRLPKKVSGFQLSQEMHNNEFSSLKPLSSGDLNCLAENHSEFEQEKVENFMILNVKSQQIYELEEEL